MSSQLGQWLRYGPTSSTRAKPGAGAAVGALALGALGSGAFAQVDSTWVAPVSGLWSNGANWDTNPDAPNNNGTDYNAHINVTGAAYTIVLDTAITVVGFEMNSSDATLDLLNQSLTVEGDFTLGAGRIDALLPGASITVDGTATLNGSTVEDLSTFTFNGAAALSGTTIRNTALCVTNVNETTILNNAVFESVGTFESLGALVFDGTLASDVCDTCIDHAGTTGLWAGGGVNFNNNAAFNNGATSTFTIATVGSVSFTGDGVGSGTVFTNDGVVVRDAGSGTASIVDMDFVNNGTVQIEVGEFATNGVTLAGGDTLDHGTWNVFGGATLTFTGQSITTLDAAVTLRDAGSSFSAIDTLETIGSLGRLEISDGRDFDFNADLTLDGAIVIGDGTTATVGSGVLTNIAGGVLAGGVYDLSGVLDVGAQTASTINADVTLNGASSSFSAIDDADTIGASGRLAIDGGRDFTTGSDFAVGAGGFLEVGAGSTFTVSGDMANFSLGGFNDGTFNIRGTLIADNAAVVDLNNTVTLDGTGSVIRSTAGVDAFEGLATIGSTGILTLRAGRDLAVLGDLVVDGVLNNENEGGAGRGFGTNLSIAGSLEHNGVFVAGDASVGAEYLVADSASLVFEFGGTSAGEFGSLVVGGAAIFGDAPGGELAGTLVLAAIGPYVADAQLGDEFQIMTMLTKVGWFADVIGDSKGEAFAHNRWFQVEMSDSLVVVRVVPAPGSLGLLGIAAIGCARRRRR